MPTLTALLPAPIVLGSQSPRRRELLGRLVGESRVRVVTPLVTEEPGFDDTRTLADIDARLEQIAQVKFDDVSCQLRSAEQDAWLVTADTVIVVFDAAQRPLVLGKPPPELPALTRTLRSWFKDHYAGRKHLAKTCICVGRPAAPPLVALVTTEVWFRSDAAQFVDWYIATGEPRGKAGGYAIQEAGSLFVDRIEGSLSNIVGLPLVETGTLLQQAGAI